MVGTVAPRRRPAPVCPSRVETARNLRSLPPRPVAWSRSSVLYSAHATQPMVLARHFPSLRQFIVPSPSQVIDNLSSYEPPTVVSISPGEEWLFAYFPGRERDGVGCLWRRGHQLDSWIVRERFTYARGGGIVAAAWHSNDRPVSRLAFIHVSYLMSP